MDPKESWSSARLIEEAILNGDNHAFAVFCERSLPPLRIHLSNVCRSFRISRSLVDDFCNDTIVKVLDYVKDLQNSTPKHYENPIRDTDAWLRTIATNTVLDFARRVSRLPHTPLTYEPPQPEPLSVEEVFELEEALDCLTPREKQVIKYIYFEELSVAKVAIILCISPEIGRAHV